MDRYKNLSIFLSIILGITGTFEGYVSDVLTIYNNGTWSNMSTTGITALSDCTIESTNPITLKRSSSSSGTHYTRYARLNSAFNLTNYNYLKATAWADQTSYTAYAGISVSTDTNCNSSAGYASTKNGSASVITIDITSLTGLYWIFFKHKCRQKIIWFLLF